MPRNGWSKTFTRTFKGRMQLNTVPAVEIIIIQMTDVTLMLNNQNSLSRIH